VCSFSFLFKPLKEPIACCELGNLYNKEAIIQALLDKDVSSALVHIRNLKDIKTAQLCQNQNYNVSKDIEGDLPALFCCPITKMEFNGNHPFILIWTTGYVLSEKALREVGLENLQGEYGPFTSDDVIKLIPTEHELETQIAAMVARRQKKKAERHAQKSAATSSVQAGDGDAFVPNGKRKHKSNESSDVGNSAGSSKKQAVGAAPATQAPGNAAPVVTSLSKSSSLVRSAATSIKDQEQSSSVFKGLFHKDHEKDAKDRDLFISVAGMRYTLG
jgi:hypothetical protein